MSLQIPGALEGLAAEFRSAGHSLYLVGGSVRDVLLGKPMGDLDLATDATPQQIKRLVQRVGPDAIYAVGERFGTIGAIIDGQKIEITTFRSETYTPRSRKPKVEFGTSLKGDLARRDFTINAIAVDLDTREFIDPFDGRGDLDRRMIRAVGNPEERFAEDPLRLMRAVRFMAQLGFELEAGTAEAMVRTADQLQHISRERILEELNRILLAPRPSTGLRALVDFGLMTYVIPEMLEMRGMEQEGWHHKDVFEHVLMVIDNAARLRDELTRPKQLALMWGALMHDIAKPRTRGLIYTCRNCQHQWFSGRDARLRPATEAAQCQQCGSTEVDRAVHFRWHEQIGEQMARDIMARLRCDGDLIESVGRLVRLHGRVNSYLGEWTDGAVRRFIREIDDDLDVMFRLSRADITSRRPGKVKAAIERINELEQRTAELLARENVQALKSPLDGNDLMQLFGRPPGPWIRPVKEYLLGLVIEGELGEDEVERAKQLATQFVAAHPELSANR